MRIASIAGCCAVCAAVGFALGFSGCQSAEPAGGQAEEKKSPAKPSDAPENKRDVQWATLVELKVEGMKCEGCAASLKKAIVEVAGAKAMIAIDVENKIAVVRGEKLDPEQLLKTVRDLGFKAERQ